MGIAIGAAVTTHLVVGVVQNNNITQAVVNHLAEDVTADALRSIPVDKFIDSIADQIAALARGISVDAVGLALPGVVLGGVIVESADLPQFKGCPVEGLLGTTLAARGLHTRIAVVNDANAVAAGIAAVHGQLGQQVRVWTLGDGVGFGCYPTSEGIWAAGHMVISLDPNEKFCACGGKGHLEGVVGGRSMRLRFLDLEPEEVFTSALKQASLKEAGAKESSGGESKEDLRCAEFVILWHRALAAATATSIHMNGPGKYYLSGPHAHFVNTGLLRRYVEEMVKFTSLQGYGFETVQHGDEAAVIGAAIHSLL